VTEDFSWSPPVWSPDGRQIASVDWVRGGIYSVPSLGGPARKLIDISGPLWMNTGQHLLRLSWSADGDWLALAEAASADGQARIVRLSLDTLEKQPLTSPPGSTLGDFYPALSPDGTWLAFVRAGSRAWGGLDVWVQPVAGGEARRLTFGEYTFCEGLTWTTDGEEILFAVRAQAWNILRVSLKGGDPQPVPGVGQDATWPSIRGARMVYAQLDPKPADIWRGPGRRASLPERPPERLIASAAKDDNPAYSPDGRRIAFSSGRGGAENIWVCDSDGSDPVQLTSFEASAGSPRWSPDGHTIVFESPEAGDWNLYTIDSEGGVPRRLTHAPSDDSNGTYAHDGRWIYFHSDRSGRREIWKIPPDGGEALQVTRGGGVLAQESWDGRFLYYAKALDQPAIWRVAVEGGEESEVVGGPIAFAHSWALSESGIYYATVRGRLMARDRNYTIQHLDLDSGQVTELYRKEGPFGLGQWLAVSPDEEWILHAESPPDTSELMLVENFR
jgi:Tol biopolymer transport system component